MRTARVRLALRIVAILAAVGGVLAVLRPWTVVPMQSTAAPAFDPGAYVESVWDTRVRSTALASAVDLQAFVEGGRMAGPGDGGTTRAVFVQGTATVAEVDRASRIGLARLRLPWTAETGVAAIQIGPVLRGTALRDALTFIRFTDFVNQLEFAGVANALNDRVITDVIGALDVNDLAGRDVAFVGAVPTGSSGTLEIVPLQLKVTGGGR